MQKFKNAVRLCLTYAAVVLLAGGYPLTAMAETTETAPPPVSEVTPPITPPAAPAAPSAPDRSYTYNPDTKHWDSDKWTYNPATGTYDAVVLPPAAAQEAQPVTDAAPLSSDSPTASSSTVNADTKATVDNTLNSTATTGNATVDKNTTGGSAATGNASAMTTLMNTINSSVSGGSGAQFASFVTDVVGDVHGDIMLYPMLLKAMLQAATTPSQSTLTAKNDAAINNTVTLNATSGNAAVTNNTTGGDATTGTANTVANVVNIINSIIAARQSFVGTVNIYGNLDGDILIAPDFLPQLLASNSESSSAPASSLVVSSQDTQSIINNIDLNAATGNALVGNNTTGGTATTGSAATNLTLLNLSGHQIVASNSMLVFVNVLGKWVGLIVDAPAGATAAALGNGVTTNDVAPDLTMTVDNNSKIVNNITLNSQSGDATVAHNTTGGNAMTGNATASANVANISGSQLGLSGWFGLLWINVFGRWDGSFGIDTAHGNPINPGAGGTVVQPASPGTPAQPFQFIADNARSAVKNIPLLHQAGSSGGAQDSQAPAEQDKADTTTKSVAATGNTTPSSGTPVGQSQGGNQFDILPFVTTTFVMGLGIIAGKNIFTFVRDRRTIA